MRMQEYRIQRCLASEAPLNSCLNISISHTTTARAGLHQLVTRRASPPPCCVAVVPHRDVGRYRYNDEYGKNAEHLSDPCGRHLRYCSRWLRSLYSSLIERLDA